MNEQRDVAHAARSGAVQALTILGQGMLTLTHVLLARLFGRAVFGAYQTSVALLEIVTRAGTAGSDKGMLRYVAAYRAQGEPGQVRSALGTGLRLAAAVSATLALLLGLGAGLVARASKEPVLESSLRLMAPAVLFSGTMVVLVQASLGAKVTRASFVVRGVAEPALLLAAGLLAALAGRTLLHLAFAHALASGATLALAIFVVGRVFGRGELARAVRAPRLPGFARFSVPLGFAELMNAVLQRADIVLLTTFSGPSAAGVYAASEFITRVIGNARSIFDSVAAPMFSEAIHLGQKERLLANLQLMTRWVATAATPIAATVLALREELLSLYGRTFRDGATAMAILAMGHVVNATLGLVGYVLVVGGRSRLLLVNNVVAAAANVGLALVLIPRFGLVGAATAALAGVIVLSVSMLAEVRIIYGVSPFTVPFAKPFVAAAVTLGVQLVVRNQIDSIGARSAAVVATALITYPGMLLALGLTPEDRRLLQRVKSRLNRWLGRQ